MLAWTIARRFSQTLRSNGFARFTSVVAIVSVSLGTLAVCVSQSILAGYDEIIKETSQRFGMHITVQRPDANLMSDASGVIESIRSIPGVVAVGEAIRQEALIKRRSVIDGAVMVGLPKEHLVHAFTGLIEDGHRLNDAEGVIIGSGLARRLASGRGDTITLITKSAGDERPSIARIRIGGVFTSGMMSYDENAVVMTLERLRSLLRTPSTASSLLMVTCVSQDIESEVVKEISHRYPEQLTVLTYRDHFAAMWNWIDLQRKPIPVIMSLIALVSMFTVVSTVLLSVVEKTRSLAVLSTLGMAPHQLALVTAIRVLSTSFIGVASGLVVSVAFIVAQRTWHLIGLDGSIYYVQHLPVAFEPWILARSSALILLAACMASILPMLITMRIRPIRALRFR